MLKRSLTAAFLLFVGGANLASAADDRQFRLSVPDVLAESGLMKYMLPRFTLKTQVRVELVSPGDAAEVALGDNGTPVFTGMGQTWSIDVLVPEHMGASRFATWISDTTGQSAITGFKIDGSQPFSLPVEEEEIAEDEFYEGDKLRGQQVSRVHCGRCHVTARGDEGLGIGSTPSFFALRSFDDWDVRFSSFYVLKPHGAFTQIEDVTEPFPEDLPSPIAPLELTLDDIDAILAYVASIEPAALGAPLTGQ